MQLLKKFVVKKLTNFIAKNHKKRVFLKNIVKKFPCEQIPKNYV